MTHVSASDANQYSSAYLPIGRWLRNNVAIVIARLHGLQVLVQNADLLYVIPTSGSAIDVRNIVKKNKGKTSLLNYKP